MIHLILYENYGSEEAVDILKRITGYDWTIERTRPGGTASFDEWRPNTAWLSGGGNEEVAKEKLEDAGIKTDYLSWSEGTVLCVDLEQVYDINKNEDMSYTDFFGKKISHIDSIKHTLRSMLVSIIMEQEEIGEMDWTYTDWAMKEADNILEWDKTVMKEAQEYYDMGKRLNLLAEIIYGEYMEKNPDSHKPAIDSDEYNELEKRRGDLMKRRNEKE